MFSKSSPMLVNVQLFKKLLLIFIFSLFYTKCVVAASTDVVVSTPTNSAITINLVSTLSDISNPVINISSNAPNGTANIVSCVGDSLLCVRYTPNNNFSGSDIIGYTVSGDETASTLGSITINVGGVANSGSRATPQTVVDNTLTDICLVVQEEDGEVVDLCESFSAATNSSNLDDLRELLSAITPQDIAAFSAISDDIAAQQLSAVGKRLSALRKIQSEALSSSFRFSHYSLRNTNKNSVFAKKRNNSETLEDSFSNKSWFVSGSYGAGRQKATDLEDGYEYDSSGLTIGADQRIGSKIIFGGAFGLSSVKSRVNGNGGNLDVLSQNLLIYSNFFLQPNLYVDAVVSIQSVSFDMSRHVIFGTTDAFAVSDTKGLSKSISLGIGYEKSYNNGIASSIFARLSYQQNEIESLVEEGAAPFDVSIDSRQISQAQFDLGLQSTYAVSFRWGVLIPQVNFDVFRSVSSKTDKVSGFFVADDTKTQFRFDVNPEDNLYMKIAIGSTMVWTGGKMSFIQFNQILQRENFSAWDISIGSRFEF